MLGICGKSKSIVKKLLILPQRNFTAIVTADKPSIIVETQNGISTIIINRPLVKNAIDFECAELLAQKIREFEADDAVKAGVLWGVETFCAGADLKSIGSGTFNRLEDEGNGPLGPSRMELSKPMIAAVSGYAVAGDY